MIWRAVIEPDFGQERFLVEHPITSAIHGRYAKIPVMLGITEIEFGYVTYSKNKANMNTVKIIADVPLFSCCSISRIPRSS